MVWEIPFMTYALEWGLGKADEVREFSKGGCVQLRTRGEGVKKTEAFADVINGRPPWPRRSNGRWAHHPLLMLLLLLHSI